MSLKNPLTLAGIEQATFRFVAQHQNRYSKIWAFHVGLNSTAVSLTVLPEERFIPRNFVLQFLF